MSSPARCLRLLVALVLVTALTARGALADEGGLVTRVEIERGRAVIVNEDGVTPVRGHDGARTLVGPAHLELSPAAHAVVRWIGQGSVRLVGPASISWERRAGEDYLRLRFGALQTADVELRRGAARLDLPGSWRVQLEPAAITLRALPSGGARLVHHAGRQARASWTGGAGVSRPESIGPGSTLRLTGTWIPTPVAGPALEVPTWPVTSWPWGAGGIPDLPDLGVPGAEAWTESDWPWGAPRTARQPWERWDWPWTARAPVMLPEVPELSSPAQDPNLEAWPPEEGQEGEAAADELPHTSETPAEPTTRFVGPHPSNWPPSSSGEERGALHSVGAELPRGSETAGYDPYTPPGMPQPSPFEQAPPAEPESDFPRESWRGLEREQLEVSDTFVLQESPDWLVEPLEGGLRRISVALDAEEPVWYFGPFYDFRVFPGATLLIEPDGGVRSHEGWVRILAVTPGRLGLSDD